MKQTNTEMFRQVGAPLANARWSWGAMRESDQAVFLRVWQDLERKHEGIWLTEITHNAHFKHNSNHPGRLERQRHIEQIRNGAPCYLIMCEAADTTARNRKIRSFDAEDLFLGGRLVDLDGETWIERKQRLPLSAVIPAK